MTTTTLAIIGASLAGAKAAEAAREAGFDGRIVMVGEEHTAPYERPSLSKEILRGEKEPESARVHADGFYADQAIELVADCATALDLTGRKVELAGGDSLGFDRLVLATGSSPRRLAMPGAELDNVHYLRTIDDAVRIRDSIPSASRVAVIGAGWIGSEVAASARHLGADVVLIDPAPAPLHRVLGDRIGGVFAALHAEHGVELRLGAAVEELCGSKTVEAVRLAGGSTVDADLVIVGVGVIPRTELVDGIARLRVDNGVVVDEHLRTPVDGVYAAGDVANAWHPHYGRRIRVEHWANALHQGAVAGRNATRPATAGSVYDRLPYFYSDQYDLGMEYVGHADPHDEIVVRGDLDKRAFIAFWHRDGIVSAAMNVNVWDVVDDLKAIIQGGRRIDADRLGDVEVPLSALA